MELTGDGAPNPAGGDLHPDLAMAKAQLREFGCATVPNVISETESERLLGLLWAAVDESKRRGVTTSLPQFDPNDSNVRVLHLPEWNDDFRDMLLNPIALELVRATIGDDFLVSNFTANIARPGACSMPVHSDQGFIVPEPWLQPWAINIIWCLTDVCFENGGTLYLPGSHKYQHRSEVPDNPRSLMKPFIAKRGSIVAMDGRLWHTSGNNITDADDRALMFAFYTLPFLRPQVNWNAVLSPQTQAGLSRELGVLLGMNEQANQALSSAYHRDNQAPPV